MSSERYNESLIEIFGNVKDILSRQGEPFRSRAYQKAQETIMTFSEDITDPVKQLKGKPGIGPSMLASLEEFVKTKTLTILEKEKNNPINLFTQIHGIGPKKAQELVNSDITTIKQLRENSKVLNDIQKVGLKYYDDIIKRIPRTEIDDFFVKFGLIFDEFAPVGSKFDIVGSYRRGANDSGDIDIIITNSNNDNSVFTIILDWLIENGVVVEVLSRGKVKSLTIVKVYSDKKDIPTRRVDFLYAPPEEYAFAILYFTGSKIFNTLMRQRALNLGYTLNEHGLSHMKDGTKGKKIEGEFPDEESIFDFLGMEYKTPEERIDGRSIQLKKEKCGDLHHSEKNGDASKSKTSGKSGKSVESEGSSSSHNKTLKKPKTVSITEYINAFKKNGISVLQMMTEKELTKLLSATIDAYYLENPILTDSLYDILREYILEKYPENIVAKEQHTSCNIVAQKKVKLPHNMWSMDKIKPDTGALEKWSRKYKGPYVISAKLDGISALYVVENDKPKLYTRGNGTYGQDISSLIPYLIGESPKSGIAIRGEIIISKEIFVKKYAEKFSNPRNFVAGIVNKKTVDPAIVSDLDFVPYEVIQPEMRPSEQMKFLDELWSKEEEPKTVKYTVKNNISNENLSELLLEWRDMCKYEIDGIIVVNDKIYPRPEKNPEYAVAFKMVISNQVAEAKVVDVIWTPSKDGYLKPRVRIEQVILGGVKIEYATGFNAQFIRDNKIGVGATISIVRSGDVIPHIVSVVVPAEEAMMPSVAYNWNETGVDIILDNKDEDQVVKEKNITGFFKGLCVDGLAAGNVKRIVEAGYESVPTIIAMKKSDFLKVEGFKDKLATKIMNSIQEKVNGASLVKLMAASNIFGRGFGERRFTAIFKMYPDILISKETEKEKIGMLTKVEGIATKTAGEFVKKIPAFLDFIEHAGLDYKLEIKDESVGVVDSVNKAHPFYGKKIVITGFRDKDLTEKIKAIGGEEGSSVTKNTSVVLVKDVGENTGKTEQAQKIGIPLMTLVEFNRICKEFETNI